MATVTAYGGVEEIGGNRILLQSDVRLFLDFGTSFKSLGRFFHEYMKPRTVRGLSDYFRMGVAPDLPGTYRADLLQQMGRPPEPRAPDAVVLSHPHLDHAGLFPLLRPDIPLVMAPEARAVLQAVQDTVGSGQLGDYLEFNPKFALKPSKRGPPRLLHADRRDLEAVPRPVETRDRAEFGRTKVVNWAVDHSVPGARGVIVECPDASIAYTGDLRLHGRNGARTQTFFSKAAGVDLLVTEGTNVRAPDEGPSDADGYEQAASKFIPESEVARVLAEEIGRAGPYCFVNYPSRDLDRLLSFHEAARRAGRRLLLTTKQAHMISLLRQEGAPVPGPQDPNLGVYLAYKDHGILAQPELARRERELLAKDYEWYEQPFLEAPNAFDAAAVRRDPSAFLVYIDYYNLTQLVDLDPPEGTYIMSKTEPFSPEMEFDDQRLQNWLDHFRLRKVRAHASGHCPPEALWHAIDEIRPKRILPIHTEHPRAFEERFGSRVTRPRLGQAVAA